MGIPKFCQKKKVVDIVGRLRCERELLGCTRNQRGLVGHYGQWATERFQSLLCKARTESKASESLNHSLRSLRIRVVSFVISFVIWENTSQLHVVCDHHA